MATGIQEQTVQTFEIVKQEEIAAPIGIVFETILEQMGPFNSTPERSMPMKLERLSTAGSLRITAVSDCCSRDISPKETDCAASETP